MTRIHPIIIMAIVCSLAAFSLMRVKFSASLYEMLPEDLPEVQGMDRLNRYFSRDGQLIVTVKAEESFLAEEAIESLADHFRNEPELVAEVFQELSISELVTEGGGLLSWLWFNGPPDDLEKLLSKLRAPQSGEKIGEAMASIQSAFFDQDVIVTSYDPLGFSDLGTLLGDEASNPDSMISADGTFQIIYLEGAGVDFSDYREAAVWLKKLKTSFRAWEEEWKKSSSDHKNVIIGLTGTPAFMAEVGAEMERDMTVSVIMTMVLISLLFWVMHRRTRPLSWLISAVLLTLVITLTFGGFLFGDLSIMSAGFAAILMGLAVDYGIVLYREAMDTKGDAKALRRSVGPGIIWAAATTAVVFLSLNFSSLPGLSEMGNLVAIGIAVGALVMLYLFAPVAVEFNKDVIKPRGLQLEGMGVTRRLAGALAIIIPLFTIGSMLLKEMPGLEANFHPFRIRESPSMIAWQTLQHELAGRENSIPTVITGKTLPELNANIEAASARIKAAYDEELLTDSVLPTSFIPAPENQAANHIAIKAIVNEEARILSEISAAGFSEDGAKLTETVFASWRHHLEQLNSNTFAKPEGKLAEWSVNRLFSEKEGVFAALGTVKPARPEDRTWVKAICDDNTVVASLSSLGTALNERIKGDLVRVFLPMMAMLSIMLAIVFRSWRDLVAGLFCLLFSGCLIVLLTIWTPMSWNSFNVCGLPLLFGTGLDFSIHMIFALRRNGGNVTEARHGIGKALVFCGTSSAIGFGSLATASAHGLASLGIVCAVGVLVNMIVAVWLLPRWWVWLHAGKAHPATT
ncbi:MMPL family transporter [Verrucomicrobiales bacterium BCK34]|nr:MMPL family transporter [Verrucomicrobiales bacterium BCK34]